LDAAMLLAALLERPDADGLVHLCNRGECTWQEYGQRALDCAAAAGLPLRARQVGPIRLADMTAFVARRPVYTPLATDKFTQFTGVTPRPWQEAVDEYIRTFWVRAGK
jgi:dTDP-4-dehydrorhamnose reductase